MTFAEESSTLERSSLRSDGRRRYFHKRYLCSWMLAALLHFILLRMVFISHITFPFQSAFSSPVGLQSDGHLSRSPRTHGNGPGMKSKTSRDSPLIRVDLDAWVSHDDWINPDLNPPGDRINPDLNPPGDKQKEEHQITPNRTENSTEYTEPLSPTTGNGDNFGLPEDNEKEGLEFEEVEMTWKDEERTKEDPAAPEETTSKEKEKTEAKDGFIAVGNARQAKSEEVVFKILNKAEIQTDEDRLGRSQERPDEQHNAAQRSSLNEEQGAQDREAEEKRNDDEERKGQTAKEKEAEVTSNSEEEERIGVEEQSNVALESNFQDEQKERGDDEAKADQYVPAQPKPSEDRTRVEEERKSDVTKPFEEQHDPEEKVKEVEEKQHLDIDRADEATPEGQCDLFEGEWEHDPEGPLYTNSTCFYMQEAQNCMSNGRPDTQYMYWRWKPRDCDLPRFDAKSFLGSFRGKTIGFIGDSIARNQMQSLLCLLSQVLGVLVDCQEELVGAANLLKPFAMVEIPIMTYVSADDSTVRWLFKGYEVTLACVWSAYLLKESNSGVMGFEKGQSVLYLDKLDTSWTSVMTDFDTIVFVTGQWYYKSSVYVDRGEVVGCHYCPTLNVTQIGFYQAYRRAIRQVLEKVSNEYKGIAIMSTFPLSHFEKGAWDKGGDCKRELPLDILQSRSFPGDHNEMRQVVLDEFNGVVTENRNLKKDARLEILDVTRVALQRADGHPGPYRRPHPFDGRDPDVYYASDCLHWCLPGPIEAWNQLVVKIVDKHIF